MTTNDAQPSTSPRRETATRRAFYLWMAAYAAVIVAIAAAHTFGFVSNGTTIDADGVRTQQAKVTGEPQSSLADHRILPMAVSYDIEG